VRVGLTPVIRRAWRERRLWAGRYAERVAARAKSVWRALVSFGLGADLRRRSAALERLAPSLGRSLPIAAVRRPMPLPVDESQKRTSA